MKQTLNLADKMIFYEKDMVNRHKQSVEEQKELEPKLDIVVLRTKEMQKQVSITSTSAWFVFKGYTVKS